MNDTTSQPAYLRQSSIAPALIPVSPSTLWRWVRLGKFPKPIKLSERVTVWRADEVRAWIDQHGLQTFAQEAA